jgi:hypothetical protein
MYVVGPLVWKPGSDSFTNFSPIGAFHADPYAEATAFLVTAFLSDFALTDAGAREKGAALTLFRDSIEWQSRTNPCSTASGWCRTSAFRSAASVYRKGCVCFTIPGVTAGAVRGRDGCKIFDFTASRFFCEYLETLTFSYGATRHAASVSGEKVAG